MNKPQTPDPRQDAFGIIYTSIVIFKRVQAKLAENPTKPLDCKERIECRETTDHALECLEGWIRENGAPQWAE